MNLTNDFKKWENVRKRAEIRNDQELLIWGSLEQRRGKLYLGRRIRMKGKEQRRRIFP